jgi:endonuclease-8
MPEGDTLHRTARALQALVGEILAAEAPHPRGAASGVAWHVDGRRLIGAEAHGKNLVLTFEGGLVVRSHLRMRGRWRVQARGARIDGHPWLVLRGSTHEAVLWNGPVLEVSREAPRLLGPDILGDPPKLDRMLQNLRAEDQALAIGEALLDQRLVAGIGNVWRAEALWHARLSPLLPLAEASDRELRAVLEIAAGLMRTSLESGGKSRVVYRRAGRPCRRCGERIRARGVGDRNRTAYWCPGCQRGKVLEAA